MKRVMIVLAATTALTAAAAAQDRGGEFGRGPMRDQFARGDGRGDFGGGPGMGRGMGGGMGGGMGMMGRFSPEDIEAFTDARIAALHAGLRLSPDQQQMWPPVEQAIRDLVKLRREQFRAWRERREQGGDPRDDLPGMLRGMAERQAVRAEALRKLAEAAAPLYASFDDGQKRRLRMLVRHMRPGGGMMRHAWRGMGRGGMDRRRHGSRRHGRPVAGPRRHGRARFRLRRARIRPAPVGAAAARRERARGPSSAHRSVAAWTARLAMTPMRWAR